MNLADRLAVRLLQTLALMGLALNLSGACCAQPLCVCIRHGDPQAARLARSLQLDIPKVFIRHAPPTQLRTWTPMEMFAYMRKHEIPGLTPEGVIGVYNGVAGGRWLWSPSIMAIRSDLPESTFRGTVEHEIGHYVWFERMTEDERKQYEMAWSMLPEEWSYRHFTVAEGFAEAFRCWCSGSPENSPEEDAVIEGVYERLVIEENRKWPHG